MAAFCRHRPRYTWKGVASLPRAMRALHVWRGEGRERCGEILDPNRSRQAQPRSGSSYFQPSSTFSLVKSSFVEPPLSVTTSWRVIAGSLTLLSESQRGLRRPTRRSAQRRRSVEARPVEIKKQPRRLRESSGVGLRTESILACHCDLHAPLRKRA